MLNCDYTDKTMHDFYSSCCQQDDRVNIIGVYPQNKIDTVLDCSPTNSWTQFCVPEVLDIPCKKPDIKGIVSVHNNVSIISQRVIKTPIVVTNGFPVYTVTNSEGTKLTGKKLVIEGLIKTMVVYTSSLPEQSLHSVHFTVPFSVFIIVSQDTPLYKKFKIDPIVEDVFTCRLSARSIYKNTTLFIKATPVC